MESSDLINVNGIEISWDLAGGQCTFGGIPVSMMWIDSTLLGLMSGIQKMVGTERFILALQSEGRNSIEDDWQVINSHSSFADGFKAINNVAQTAGWGSWNLVECNENEKKGIFRLYNSWEGRYQKELGVNWGSAFAGGKLAGYCSKLFGTYCWPTQTAFIAKGDPYDEFIVTPSVTTIEDEINKLLLSDNATHADMAVALEQLRIEIIERQQVEKTLEKMAHYDVLTHLPNRTLFADRFSQAVAHSNRTESMLAICFLDLDNFKPINDDYGHDVGDKLLIDVAHRIKTTIREEDTASRQGGDEFTLLLRDIKSFQQCEETLKRVQDALAEPYLINGVSHKITASIGTTIYPLDDSGLDTLIRHADHAMYQAKLAGENQLQLFNALNDRQTVDKQAKLEEIKNALANKQFQLYYQPKVNMRAGKVFGVEALIRWFHPEKGMIPPLDFLSIIEATDLEIQIGGWVINEAVTQLGIWKQQGLELEVSINVSSHHLQAPVFFDQLNETLDKHPDVNSQDLQLEILESSVLGDLNVVSGIIKSCQDVLGVKVALDDFGTGYSSLTHLRNLSASTIKIDQTFVRDMLEDKEDLALIEGIIGLAKTFDRNVIAEGVETAEHGVLLMRIGCDRAQGYGIARPMPAVDIAAWMKDYKPDESWSIWSGSEWEMSNLPLVVAQSDHMKWIEEIFNVLEGHELALEHEELTDHHECRLGKWYYGHGKKHYGHLPVFQEFEAIHEDVHKTGHQIIRLYNDGKKEEATQLSEELLVLKSQVLDTLNTLQKQVSFSEEHK